MPKFQINGEFSWFPPKPDKEKTYLRVLHDSLLTGETTEFEVVESKPLYDENNKRLSHHCEILLCAGFQEVPKSQIAASLFS